MTLSHNLNQLRRCPACDDDLGVPPSHAEDGSWRRPSLLLEVCGTERGAMEWRLSSFDDAVEAQSKGYHRSRPGWVYRMCGDGHVFLDHIRMTGEGVGTEWTVDDFDVSATIGGVAAGKSYLVLRTLHQQLSVSGLPHITSPDRPMQVNSHTVDWLEDTPLQVLLQNYRETEEKGLPLGPTVLRTTVPFHFLSANISPDVVPALLELQEKLGGEGHLDRSSWGRRIRQPILCRYQIGGRRVLIAVADLAGEQFAKSALEDDYHQRLLRNYGTLTWVIDPAIAKPFASFIPEDTAEETLAASVRPGESVNNNLRGVLHQRNSVQRRVAGTLAQEASPLAANIGARQHVLVCVTKMDLVHLGLRRGRRLDELGEPGAIVKGAARYLAELAVRFSGPNRRMVEDAALHSIVDPIDRTRHEPNLFEATVRQFATAIVDHHANPDAWWNLVHVGGGAVIQVREGEHSSVLPASRILLPSLDSHIAGALTPHQSAVLRTRDLVMSALGCGIAFALGFEQRVESMLGQKWRDVRFFLCSPLEHAPVRVAATSELIEPQDASAVFPDVDERSAALSQLLLCLLRRMRP
jgi:hypothetical protein